MILAFQRVRGVAFCTGLAGSGLALGASVFEAPFEEARAVYDGIFDAIVVERKICEEELARGVQQGTWTEAEQREGVAWLQASFDAVSQIRVSKLDAQSEVLADPRWNLLKEQLNQHRGVTALNNAACVEFFSRVVWLDDARNVAAMKMCEAAILFAEDVWLDAKTPADLAPAVRAIDYVRRAGRVQWDSYAKQPFGRIRKIPSHLITGPGVTQEVVETAMHFRSVIGIPKPLLLPDPDQNPTAFWEVSKQWQAMVAMKHLFVLRPRIAGRFAELNARYRARMEAVRKRLDRMILTDAPVGEFENALQDFPEKPVFPSPPSPSSPPDPRSNPMQPPGTNPSYLDLIPKAPISHIFPGERHTAFARWLDFKRAEESGDDGKLRTAAAELEKARTGMTPEVAKFVAGRLNKALAVENEESVEPIKLGPPSGNPAKDLIEALALQQDAAPLAEAWQRVVDGDASPIPEMPTFSRPIWRDIVVATEGSKVIDLREQATRQALASITKSASVDNDTEPVATKLIEAFEKAFSAGDKTQARRLLQLDMASSGLPYDLHLSLRRIVELLPDAADPTLEQDKTAITRQLRALLSQATSPAAARFASEQLKKERR
jgi:hypothetical protein